MTTPELIEFQKYMKKKDAFLKIYEASFNPTPLASVSLTYEECAFLLSLFDKNEIAGFIN